MGDLTDPGPLLEVAIGTIGLVVVMFFHGISLRFINRHYSAAWVRIDATTPHWRVNLLLAPVVFAFAVTHLVETLIWAVPIHRLGMIPDLRDAYYYVLESYTTLGEGEVSLPDQWRLIGPIIAMSGLFTFGWTARRPGRDHDRVRPARSQPRPAAAEGRDRRSSRPLRLAPEQALRLRAPGADHDVLPGELARAVWLPARARSTSTCRPRRPPGGGAGDHVAHVHEAVGLLGESAAS